MIDKTVLHILFVAGLWIAVKTETCEDPNAYWSETDATICQNTCERPDLALYCKPAGHVAGCICNHGYLKNKEGKCALPEECAIKETCEDPNAYWSETDATICQNTCERPDLALYCKPAGPVAGCICNDGYLKNKEGKCALTEECAIKGTCDDPNAEFSLSMATGCQDTCRSPDTQSRCSPAGPQAGCVCNQGFVKNEKNRCVTIFDCEPLNCTNPHEVYDPCPPQCPTEFCDQAHLNGVCPYSYSELGIRFTCIPACRCEKGFFRKFIENYESVCIPREECNES